MFISIENNYKVILLLIVTFLLKSTALSQNKKEITLLSDSLNSKPIVLIPDYYAIPEKKEIPFPIVNIRRPKVALVLSGGGARGISHLGVLKVLKENNIPIDIIYGTSIGSIIGGLYSIGYNPEKLLEWLKSINLEEVFSFSDDTKRKDLYPEQKQNLTRSFLTLRFKGLEPIIPISVSSGQRITNMINALVLNGIHNYYYKFDDFPIPFRSVATDIISGRSILISEGDLSESIRASFTWPLLNPTVDIDSMRLVDGGILANIPVHFAKEDGYDVIIAVDATSKIRTSDQIKAPWEILDQVLSIMQEQFSKKELCYANVIIKPNLDDHRNTDFSGLDSLVQLGEYATKSKISDIINYISDKEFSSLDDKTVFVEKIVLNDSLLSSDFKNRIRNEQENKNISYRKIKQILHEIHNQNYYKNVSCEIKNINGKNNLIYNTIAYPIINAIVFSGNQLIEDTTIYSIFSKLLRKPFNYKIFEETIDTVLQIYRNSEYSLAKIHKVTFDSVTSSLFINFDEGKIKKINIEGNKTTKDWVILREFPLGIGNIFSLKKAQEGITNIASTNLFDYVFLNIKNDEIEPIITIKVQEKYYDLIRIGLRIDNEKKTQALFDIRNENFEGSGNDLGLCIQGGASNFQSLLDFKTNKLFNTPFTYKLKLKYQFEELNVYQDKPTDKFGTWRRIKIGDFREVKYGGSLMFGGQYQRLGYLYGEFKYEHQSINPLSGTGQQETNNNISSLKVGLIIDTKDDYPYARNGTYFNIFHEISTDKLGSSLPFTKDYLLYESFFTVKKSYTLHPRIVLGFGDKTVPYTEQFRFGSQESFFGLHENEYRGRQLVVGSLEYRWLLPFKIFFDTFLSVRFDIGTIWELPENIRFKDFRYGIGTILGLDTPIGPAEFSIGNSFLLNRDLPANPVSFGPLFFYFRIGYDLDF